MPCYSDEPVGFFFLAHCQAKASSKHRRDAPQKILETCFLGALGVRNIHIFFTGISQRSFGAAPCLVRVSALLIVFVRFFAHHFNNILHSISTALNH
jgi:hypothetical protein